jgi:hypothetical protein
MESSRFHSYLKNRILNLPYRGAVLGQYGCRNRIQGCQNIFIYLFIYWALPPHIALDPTFGSFTLLEPVSH